MIRRKKKELTKGCNWDRRSPECQTKPEPGLNWRICSKGLMWYWRSWPAGSSGENELEQAEQETSKKRPEEQAGRVGRGGSERRVALILRPGLHSAWALLSGRLNCPELLRLCFGKPFVSSLSSLFSHCNAFLGHNSPEKPSLDPQCPTSSSTLLISLPQQWSLGTQRPPAICKVSINVNNPPCYSVRLYLICSVLTDHLSVNRH